ncbi:MAG TPA: sigma-70 family RNA polymerase sigma factor [Candidatus Udaeobacter sp.]|nr:sigma-70 family RNA polymerase sigma factor [Candidatus Udaeobacter sp.]
MSAQSQQDDRALIAKVAAGDSNALDKLYRKYYDTIDTFVRSKFSLSDLDVADIVQDVFRRVQQKAWQYRPSGRVRSWIFKIAQNLVKDTLKQHSSRRVRETKYAFAHPSQGGEVEGAEQAEWEVGDAATAPGGICGKSLPASSPPGALYCVVMPCNFVLIPRAYGGDNLVWVGVFPERRSSRGKRDRMRTWLNGAGQDSIRGMFKSLGLVAEK